MTVRTRFAPSPTGFQHIGGFRTAMYAWLLAKQNGGQFLLRIEDTDRERLVPGAIKYLVDSLHWLGIDYDEGPNQADLKAINEFSEFAPVEAGKVGPYIQSERLSLYQKEVERLISEGKAYRCDCSSERLEIERLEQMARRERPGYSGYCRTRNLPAGAKTVVRFRLPDQIKLSMNDAVRGVITWDNPPLRDPVILKSDGFPTYHLASVVDDHYMGITHVLRGEEWLPTTPIHILLYEAFGWEKPVFVHLSHILGPDGKKLSKRHGADALTQYEEQGILPEALLNYVSLIGWSVGSGDEQEVFTRDELIQKFSLDGLNSSGGVFDPAKLQWMNGVYLRSLSSEKFTELANKYITSCPAKSWEIIAPHVQERIKTLPEIIENIEFLCLNDLPREMNAIFNKNVNKEIAKQVVEVVAQKFSSVAVFTVDSIHKALEEVVAESGLKTGQVFPVVRIAVTGKKATPPLSESILALGKEKTLQRLAEMPALIEAYQE